MTGEVGWVAAKPLIVMTAAVSVNRPTAGPASMAVSCHAVAVGSLVAMVVPANPRLDADAPIAMFDSGFGGLTVARAVIDLLPHEPIVYLGDTARYPYGPRSQDEVRAFSHQIAEHLVDECGAKLLIVACNTAAAAALDELQDRFDIPVIGVIEPGVRSVLKATENRRVGVIGTVGTIESGAYQDTVADHAACTGLDDVELCALSCPGFVEFVERGEFDSHQVHVLAERLLAPAVEFGVDSLLLGCTHYPYLARTIAEVMGREVVLVSSADETAFEIADMLVERGLDRDEAVPTPAPRFLTTGDVDWFQHLGSRLLGPELERAERVTL